jgi:hypothetical protein
MKHDGRIIGLPLVDYTDTESNIEALSGLEAGMTAYASDTEAWGYYDGTAWQWWEQHPRLHDVEDTRDHETTETDTGLVLKPDGAGFVEFAALDAADLPAGGYGSGTAGRVTRWAAGGVTLEDSNLIGPAANVLMLEATGAHTATVPATGAVVLRDAGTALTAGRVLFATDANTAGDDVNLAWATATARLSARNINLPNQQLSADALHGIIYKDGTRFIHNFRHPTGGTARPTGLNTFIGFEAGNLTMGETASSTDHASRNVGIGRRVLRDLTIGYENLCFGERGMQSLTEGYENMGLGRDVMSSATTAYRCTAIGSNALGLIIGGHDIISIGWLSGRLTNDGSGNRNSFNSIYIGSDSRPSADGNQNEVVIGHEGRGNGSNTVTLGNTSITDTYLFGTIHTDNGWSGTFTNGDGDTVTVLNGLITDVS